MSKLVVPKIPKNKQLTIVGIDKEQPYWKENGWKESTDVYKGLFITGNGRWRGLIEKTYFGNHAFFIFDPPEALRKSSHWPCFSHKGCGKYSIHFSQKSKDISSGIITIEQLLVEAFKEERRQANVIPKVQKIRQIRQIRQIQRTTQGIAQGIKEESYNGYPLNYRRFKTLK